MSNTAKIGACENCRFFDTSTTAGDDDQDITGLCRAKAPRVHIMTGKAIWPFVEETDWCGAWQHSSADNAEGGAS